MLHQEHSKSDRLSRRRNSLRHRQPHSLTNNKKHHDDEDIAEVAMDAIVVKARDRRHSRNSKSKHNSKTSNVGHHTSAADSTSSSSLKRRSCATSNKSILSGPRTSSFPHLNDDPADLFNNNNDNTRRRSSSKRCSQGQERKRLHFSYRNNIQKLRNKVGETASTIFLFSQRVVTDGTLASLAATLVLLIGLAMVDDTQQPFAMVIRVMLAVGVAADVYARRRLPDSVLVVLFATTAVRLCSFVPFGGWALLLNVSGAFGLGFINALESLLRPRSSHMQSSLYFQMQQQQRGIVADPMHDAVEESLASNRRQRRLHVLQLFRGTFFGVWTSFPGMVADAAENGGGRWGAAYILGALLMCVYGTRFGRVVGSFVVKELLGSRRAARKILASAIRVLPAACAFISVCGAVDVSALIMYAATVGGCLCGDSLSAIADDLAPPSLNAHGGGHAETWMGVVQQAVSNTVACLIALFAAQSQARLPVVMASRSLWLTSEVEGSVAGSASGFCDTVVSADAVFDDLLRSNGNTAWPDESGEGERRRRSQERRLQKQEAAGVVTAISDTWPDFHWIAFTIDLVVAFQMLLWYPTVLPELV